MCSEGFEAPKYVVGIVANLPFPQPNDSQKARLSELFYEACNLKLIRFSRDELSHDFISPVAGGRSYSASAENGIIMSIISEIDDIATSAYGLSSTDTKTIKRMLPEKASDQIDAKGDDDEVEEGQEFLSADTTSVLSSWAVGIAFGRFDWRLAAGVRSAPMAREPFDPLPAKSPGMLQEGDNVFHENSGVLVDDQGHQHDLARLIEEVLSRVEIPVHEDLRQWLQRDFFPYHFQRYSKSRRKAPIYWPLSTVSSSYTLWIYYPLLNNQTLFAAVNDFLDGPNGKLTQVTRECAEFRIKGNGRSREEEKQYETLQIFEQELTDLRNTLLKIAPTYQPNHDDGVQITAAPLWPLFRHKPWQKELRDTWAKLEKGDYDWAHIAMAYWPDRVREKCKTDKSLAIAHGLEDLYVEPEAAPKKTRSKKKAGAN